MSRLKPSPVGVMRASTMLRPSWSSTAVVRAKLCWRCGANVEDGGAAALRRAAARRRSGSSDRPGRARASSRVCQAISSGVCRRKYASVKRSQTALTLLGADARSRPAARARGRLRLGDQLVLVDRALEAAAQRALARARRTPGTATPSRSSTASGWCRARRRRSAHTDSRGASGRRPCARTR